MREVTIICENRVGALADITEALGAVGVNLKAISAMGVGETGVIRLITEDETTARRVLEQKGFRISVGDVLIVKMKDRPGELAKIARKIAAAGVNIESVYLLGHNGLNTVELAIKAGDIRAAEAALRK